MLVAELARQSTASLSSDRFVFIRVKSERCCGFEGQQWICAAIGNKSSMSNYFLKNSSAAELC